MDPLGDKLREPSPAADDQACGHDELGRLTAVTTATTQWALAYDANGNRTLVERNGQPSAYTTSTKSNQLLSVSLPARNFEHDEVGNVTGDGIFSASYDASGRMASLQRGRVTTYEHDTRGLRVRTLDSTGAHSLMVYVHDPAGHLLGEYDANGAAVREYVWLGNTPLAVFTPDPVAAWKPPLVSFIHTDHLDTPRVVLDTQGRTRWRWLTESEPFGSAAPETDPSGLGAFTLPLRMPGQYADGESGLFYNWRRDYDPAVGRYIHSDPIGLAGGINTYAYAEGNPVSYTDPTGELALIGGGIGALGNLGWQLWKNGGNLKCVNWWEVGAWGLTGSGVGLVGRAGLTGVGNFFWNSNRFSSISRAYWGARGGAGGMSLDHWAISQAAGRSGAAPQGFVNGGWNLLEMPASWNTWLGFAPNWGGSQAALAEAARLGVQLGVPGVAVGAGVAGYEIGTRAQQVDCECRK